ncbi:MAG: heavy-metal-associated domain-containing protein [Acidimicrobiales bacterium]
MNVETFKVAGMTCDHCVRAVTAELSAIGGVESVSVDLAAGQATVSSSQALDRARVQAAVEEAGFELVT